MPKQFAAGRAEGILKSMFDRAVGQHSTVFGYVFF